METCDYSDLLRGIAAKRQMLVTDLAAADLALIREAVNLRLRAAWSMHRWPELCPTEQRQYRVSYDATGATTYNATDEVLDVATLNYFQSLQDANVGNPPTIGGAENSAFWALSRGYYQAQDWAPATAYAVGTQVRNVTDHRWYQCITAHTSGSTFDPTQWGVLTPFQRVIAYVQTWNDDEGNPLLPIGAYLQAWDRDPRITTKKRQLRFDLNQQGAVFTLGQERWPCNGALAYVWLVYRLRIPNLLGEVWDETVVYASGQQTYFQDPTTQVGNFYTATTTTNAGDSPDSVPESWTVIPLPAFLKNYLIVGGYGDWAGDAGASGDAASLLELEVDILQRQEQQVRRFTFN